MDRTPAAEGQEIMSKAEDNDQEDAAAVLDAIFRHIPEGLIVADAPNVRIRRVSAYGLERAGERPDQLVGIAVAQHAERWQVYRPEDASPASPHELPLTRAVRRGEVVENEAWLMRGPGGRLLTMLCNAGPIRNARGEITGGIVAWRDVTELKAAEEALRRSNEHLQFALDAAGMFAWEWHFDSDRVSRSPNAARVFGVAPDAMREDRAWMYDTLALPEDRPVLEAAAAEAVERGKAVDVEFRIRRGDGEIRWMRTRGRVVRDGAGRPHHVHGICMDVTDQRAALEQKDLMVREVNHRVANNLQTISSLLRIQARMAGRDVAQQLEEAQSRIALIAGIHQRLHRARHLDRIDFADLLRGVAGDLERAQAGTGRVWRISVDAEPVELSSDCAVPLGLIATELATNAIKYAYPGAGTGPVNVEFRREDGYLRLSVSDRGRGLPPGFDPVASRGFGMQLVLGMVNQLNGTLQVRDLAPGAGFRVDVPVLSQPGE